MPTPFTSDEEFDAQFRRGLEHDADWSAIPDADAWQRMEQLLDAEPTPPAPRRVRRGRSVAALLLLLLVAGLSGLYHSSLRRWATGHASATAGAPNRAPRPAASSSQPLPTSQAANSAIIITGAGQPAAPSRATSPTPAAPATPLVGPTSPAAATTAARPTVVATATPDTTGYLVRPGAGSSPSRSQLPDLSLGSGTTTRRPPAPAEALALTSQPRKQLLHDYRVASSRSSAGAEPVEVAERGLPTGTHGAAASGPAVAKRTSLAELATPTTRRLPTPRALAAAASVTGHPAARLRLSAPTEARRLQRASLRAALSAPTSVARKQASDGLPEPPAAIAVRVSVASRRAARHRVNSSVSKNQASTAAIFDAEASPAAHSVVQAPAAPAARPLAPAQPGTEQPPQPVAPLVGTGLPSGLPDSLPAALSLARVTPFDSLPRPKPLPDNTYRLHIGLLAAPELSAVRQHGTGIGGSAGIEVEYRLAARWRLSTGYLQAIKHYAAAGSDYRIPVVLPANWILNDVTASCRIIDVPLNLRYDVWQGAQRRAFVSGGLSSLFMRREDYTYNYEVGGKPRSSDWQFLNYSNHPFQVLNLTVGYEQRLNQRWALQVEPYLKLPLGGVGYGAVRLQSAGVFFSLKYGLLRGPAAR